jgi:energy-coupling factor transporter transmembrane protein EcfT
MIRERVFQNFRVREKREPLIGTLGHLSIFACSLGIIIFSPGERIAISSALCLLVTLWLHPASIRRVLRMRLLLLLGSLILVNGLWVGAADIQIGEIPFSSLGLQSGVQMALRAVVILMAVEGFSSSVDISEIAGLLERLGLSGLGFSIGIAVNLLSSLRETSANVWRSLYMRGGFRQQRWRAMQLFMVTFMANALRRGEEITLAAEARAYAPERTRALPLKKGCLDGWILAGGFIVLFAFFLIL